MALRIELKPQERLIINGALIRNGDRRSTFVIENQCKFLRESEILTESEADTAAKRLCVTLQFIYLADNPPEAEDLFVRQATEIMKASPSMGPYILAIQDELSAHQYHRAIKRGRELIAYERQLLDHLAAHAAEPAPQG
ncbi:flagellar FlbT family protein [Methylorubrum populi BJ001]|jgi:flagellar protein FlbT|uniref:Flagellar FlbT family protein n=1 Tax=Methylorubrum populi (strain ATCC BAA-705 / NCIMB 13946 / BJ001) TaxID=441620 RepID=B1ZC24_METPB|nr:flagellar biosynthesis repressor FlbT [Methylorubrum populi]ACB79367.1 flagellar FlbT family protein [Methylorubrum populi BJ001]OAH37151.1 flagellar protein FlbT [Methylorubrum populi]PZP69626.1 MAG: flagellar protein FlbT [Methylorubrum populi]